MLAAIVKIVSLLHLESWCHCFDSRPGVCDICFLGGRRIMMEVNFWFQFFFSGLFYFVLGMEKELYIALGVL